MSWQTDVSVWTDKPDSIQVFSDDGQEQDYVPERTCKRITRGLDRKRIVSTVSWVCSECGKHMSEFDNYCPNCGARVTEEDTDGRQRD